METKYYKIFTSAVAGYLAKKGFKIVNKEVNKKDPMLEVFIFEDTPKFRDALTKMTNQNKKQ